MEFLEELKEARRAKFRNDFFDELERVGIQREQYFDPVESGIRSNLVKISNFTAKLFRLENFQLKIRFLSWKFREQKKSLLRKIACDK